MQPVWQARTAQTRNPLQTLEVWLQHDARHDRNIDAIAAGGVQKFEIVIRLKEELRDRTVSASILLGFQNFEILRQTKTVRMWFRIGRNRNLEALAQFRLVVPNRFNQLNRSGEPFRMRGECRPHAFWRVAAQRHNVLHARFQIIIHDAHDVFF